MRRLILALVVAMVLAMSSVAGVFACEDETPKCNSGRGNGSEPEVATDCDPGNSAGHNSGGD